MAKSIRSKAPTILATFGVFMVLALALTAVHTAIAEADGICDRTETVKTAIVSAAPVDSCGDVTAAHLADVTELDLSESSISTLKAGDFDGLTALRKLDLSGNSLASLPDGVFDQLLTLEELRLHDNSITSLSADIFQELYTLQVLTLSGNSLTSLPDGMFGPFHHLRQSHLAESRPGERPGEAVR